MVELSFFWVVVWFVFQKVGSVKEVVYVIGWLCIVVELVLDLFDVQLNVFFGIFWQYWIVGFDFFDEVVIMWSVDVSNNDVVVWVFFGIVVCQVNFCSYYMFLVCFSCWFQW